MDDNKIDKALANKYTTPMLEKGFEVIEFLSNFSDGVSMQDIMIRLNQPKTSLYRLLNSLMQMGYVCKNEETSRYFLSKKLLKIGLAALGESNIVERSLPHMQILRDSIKETVMLGVVMHNKVVLLEQVLGSYNFTFLLRPGSSFNIHSSAPGKLFVAYSSENEQKRLLDNINYEIFNERTINSKERMLEEACNILSLGYAVDLQEEMDGVNCVAAPIFNQFGNIVAALWTSGPSGRLKEYRMAEVAEKVIKAANNISINLGYNKTT